MDCKLGGMIWLYPTINMDFLFSAMAALGTIAAAAALFSLLSDGENGRDYGACDACK